MKTNLDKCLFLNCKNKGVKWRVHGKVCKKHSNSYFDEERLKLWSKAIAKEVLKELFKNEK